MNKGLRSRLPVTGMLYFYIHFVTEIICFFVLGRYSGSSPLTWLLFFAYDMLAFVPQALIGYVNDKHPKLSLSLPGLVLLGTALILSDTSAPAFVSLVILCLGNAFIHVNGAELTLRTSGGKLSHSAVFVAGGSFGVITGKLLAETDLPGPLLLIPVISAFPFAVLAQTYLKEKGSGFVRPCPDFRYHNPRTGKAAVIILSVLVVAVRGYMAYGIPTSWKKTAVQAVLLYVFMGLGKALGGICSDVFGVRRTGIFSVLFSVPFLISGDNNMYVSLIGVLFFSMTMSISLSVLVSVLPGTPGLAFGLTTTGLFLGVIPVSFFTSSDKVFNIISLTVLSALCILCLAVTVRKDGSDEQRF